MNKTIVVHGIPTCDSVKKARAWLQQHGLAHHFHDLRRDGLPAASLDRWIAAVGWQALVNRQGTTWRGLDSAVRSGVVDAATARAVLQEHVSVVKRPVVEWDDRITVGFDPAQWEQATSR